MIRSVSVVLLILLALLSKAQEDTQKTYCPDSLFLQQNADGSQYLLWQIGPETSLADIVRQTRLPVSVLEEINPILYYRTPQPCDRLLIPFDVKTLSFLRFSDSYPVFYRVRRGETIFGIAHRMLQVPVDTLLILNQLEDVTLRTGQILKTGFLQKRKNTGVAEEFTWAEKWLQRPGYTVDMQMVNTAPDKVYKHQRGVAWWNKDNRDPNLFALHRSAPINSLIEIRNPMFDRSVWAKVVGTIPPTYADDICIIVSPGVAKYLGAIDGRFYVEMSFEEP